MRTQQREYLLAIASIRLKGEGRITTWELDRLLSFADYLEKGKPLTAKQLWVLTNIAKKYKVAL